MNITQRAMLASLHIRMWGATRTDKTVTEQVAAQHSVTTKRAGHYRKHAIDVDAPTYKAVKSAGADMRHRHYFWTLPWGEDGARILPAANFEKYSAEMRGLRARFDAAVTDFVADYPALRSRAQSELNGLYNAMDYPRDIGTKFGIDVGILPLPDSEDFRVSLPDEAVAQIKSGIEQEMQRTTEAAMRDPYQRLYDHVARMVERLGNPESVFRDTLVTGLNELCGVLPGLNITNDPRLEELRKRAESMIAGIDAQTLRDKPMVRATVAKQAEEIHDLMATFMGAAS